MRGRFRSVQWLGLLLSTVVVLAAGSPVDAAKAKKEKTEKSTKAKPIEKASYGTVDGKPVDLYTLTNAKGAVAKITNYGAIVTELHMPDKSGKMGDVVLGFDKVDDYVAKSPYFGAIVGRVANRIANGKFTLDGKAYQLNTNNAPHHLHGGAEGDQGRSVAEADARVARRRRELPGHGHRDGDVHADQRERAEGRDD